MNKLITGVDGWEFWQRSFVVVYVGLFLFSLTYWGNHGLGDSARLPLGHGEEIVELNGTETLFEGSAPFMVSEMAGAQSIDSFQVTGKRSAGGPSKLRTSFIIWLPRQVGYSLTLKRITPMRPRVGCRLVRSFNLFGSTTTIIGAVGGSGCWLRETSVAGVSRGFAQATSFTPAG